MSNARLAELTATIKAKVASDPRWASAAITTLYRYQTAQEQAAEQTIEHNRVGFNGVDGEILSSFARRIISGRALTEKQLRVAYRALPKYAGQLARIAADKTQEQGAAEAVAVASAQPVEDEMSAEELAEERAAVQEVRAAGAVEDIRWSNEFARREAEQERAAYVREMEDEQAVERMVAAARRGDWNTLGDALDNIGPRVAGRVGQALHALNVAGEQWTVNADTRATNRVLAEAVMSAPRS